MSDSSLAKSSAMSEFEAKLKDRIREDIAELIPDEVLAEMIRKTINDQFMQTRKICENPDASSYYQRWKESPPWLLEVVQPLIKTQIDAHVTGWAQENSEKIAEMVRAEIGESGEKAITRAISSVFSSAFVGLEMNIRNNIQNSITLR
jgi:hypothetical protein